MKYRNLLYQIAFCSLLLLGRVAWAQGESFTTSFEEAFGQAPPTDQEIIPIHRLLIQKIRVDTWVNTVFGDPQLVTLYYDILFKPCLTVNQHSYLLPILTAEEPTCELDDPGDFGQFVLYGTGPDTVGLEIAYADYTLVKQYQFDVATLSLMETSKREACAHLQVNVINAHTQSPMPAVEIRLGGITQISDELGSSEFNHLFPDRWQLEIRQRGFEPFIQEVELLCPEVQPLTVALIPLPPPKEIWISLNWSEEQIDLDAHLTGPDPGAKETYYNPADRFHLYFGNKNFTCLEQRCTAQLHTDEVIETRPEILVLSTPENGVLLQPGEYLFAVHYFEGPNRPLEPIHLQNSGISVELHIDGEAAHVFTPPPLDLGKGDQLANTRLDTWYPFKFEVLSDGNIWVNPPLTNYAMNVNPHEIR